MIKRRFCQAIGRLLDGGKDMHRVSIADKFKVTHDSFIMRCKFDTDKIVGVPQGHHLRIHFEGDQILDGRTYTPLNDLDEKGVADILVKVYRPCANYPAGGKMGQYLESLKVGDQITVSGPRGKYIYNSNGEVQFKLLKMTRDYKKISFIAGGSGITPIYQMLVNFKKSDPTIFTLLYANKSEADILLRKQLEKFDSLIPNFSFKMTVDKAESSWPHFTGYVDQAMIKQVLPEPSEDHLVWVCGPKDMNLAVRQQLIDCGHSEDCVYLY